MVLAAILMCCSGPEGEGGGAEGYFTMQRHHPTEVLLSNLPPSPSAWGAPLSRRHYGFPCWALIVDANAVNWFGNLDLIRLGINVVCAGTAALVLLVFLRPGFTTRSLPERQRSDLILVAVAGAIVGGVAGFLLCMKACAAFHASHTGAASLLPDSVSQTLSLLIGGGLGIIVARILIRES